MPKTSNPRFRLYGSARDYVTIAHRIGTGRWDRGDHVDRLEADLAARSGAAHAICVAKARVGIFLAIRALIRPGQEVILSPYTISDVVNMVVCAGGVPVFADIARDTCNVDAAQIEALITPATGAVLITHLHGLACDVHRIATACARSGIPLVEDAAQAFGTRVGGTAVGTFGAAGVYSFGMYKNVNAFFGGAIVTNDGALAQRLRAEVRAFPVQEVGYYLSKVASAFVTDLATFPPTFNAVTFPLVRYANRTGRPWFDKATSFDHAPTLKRTLPETYLRRLSSTQAYVVARQLPERDHASELRIAAAVRYREGLADLPGVQLPPARTDFSHTYTYYPVQVDRRDQVLAALLADGRDIGAQHLRNCADMPCFSDYFRDCPNARSVAGRLILLPTYPRYGMAEVDRTITALRRVMSP